MTRIHRIADLAVGLFEARGGDLLRYLRRRVGNDADARDIAQETYLRFIRLGDPDRIDNVEAYLFRIASNLLSEYQLRERNLASRAVFEEPATMEQTPFDLAVSSEKAHRLGEVLQKLPATRRAVLVLHLRDGLTYAQIGAQIGVSVSMVKKHLAGALAFCRQRLRDLED